MLRRLSISALTFASFLLTQAAWAESAQPKESADETSSSAPPSDVAPQGVDVEDATDEQKQQAQEAFLAGDKAFDIQDYGVALEHFQRSYGTVASPNSRLMVARSYLELGRLDEAYDEYSGVIKDAKGNDDYKETGSTARKEREALRHRLAWLTITLGDVPEGATLKIGGRQRSVDDINEPIAVTPGQTMVIATTEDNRSAEATVHLAAGRSAELELKMGESVTVGSPPPPKKEEKVDPEPVSEPEPAAQPAQDDRGPSLKPWAYVAGGVGLVGFGAFGAFGVLSGQKYSDLEDACADGSCPTDSQDDIDAGKQMQLFANIGLGVGIAGIGTGVLLFLLDGKKTRPVEVNVGYQSVSVKGSF